MWELKITRQFKKDLKKYKNRQDKMSSLLIVLKMLQKTGIVPREYKPHNRARRYHRARR